MQIVKNIIKKCTYTSTDYRLALLEYQNTPLNECLPSPAEILQNRKLRSILPLRETALDLTVNKSVRDHLINRQNTFKTYYDRDAKQLSPLKVGQMVKIKHENKGIWKNGKVNKILRNRSYEILTQNGNKIIRNRRHIIPDSQYRPQASPEYGFEFDHVQPTPAQAALTPAQVNVNTNRTDPYVTRSGRTVIPPSRWGHWENYN